MAYSKILKDDLTEIGDITVLTGTIQTITPGLGLTSDTATVAYDGDCHEAYSILESEELEFLFNCPGGPEGAASAFAVSDPVYVFVWMEDGEMQIKIAGHLNKDTTPLCKGDFLLITGTEAVPGTVGASLPTAKIYVTLFDVLNQKIVTPADYGAYTFTFPVESSDSDYQTFLAAEFDEFDSATLSGVVEQIYPSLSSVSSYLQEIKESDTVISTEIDYYTTFPLGYQGADYDEYFNQAPSPFSDYQEPFLGTWNASFDREYDATVYESKHTDSKDYTWFWFHYATVPSWLATLTDKADDSVDLTYHYLEGNSQTHAGTWGVDGSGDPLFTATTGSPKSQISYTLHSGTGYDPCYSYVVFNNLDGGAATNRTMALHAERDLYFHCEVLNLSSDVSGSDIYTNTITQKLTYRSPFYLESESSTLEREIIDRDDYSLYADASVSATDVWNNGEDSGTVIPQEIYRDNNFISVARGSVAIGLNGVYYMAGIDGRYEVRDYFGHVMHKVELPSGSFSESVIYLDSNRLMIKHEGFADGIFCPWLKYNTGSTTLADWRLHLEYAYEPAYIAPHGVLYSDVTRKYTGVVKNDELFPSSTVGLDAAIKAAIQTLQQDSSGNDLLGVGTANYEFAVYHRVV